MQRLETQLSNGSASRAAMDAHIAMHLVAPDTTALPGAVGISPASGRRLCNVITAYRLMDVLYSLRDVATPYQNPRYGQLPLKGLQPKSKVFASSFIFLDDLSILSSRSHCTTGSKPCRKGVLKSRNFKSFERQPSLHLRDRRLRWSFLLTTTLLSKRSYSRRYMA